MKVLLASCVVYLSIAIGTPSSAQQVFFRSASNRPTDQAWSAVLNDAGSTTETFWAGFSFSRMMEEGAYFQKTGQWTNYTYHVDGLSEMDAPSLMELVTGRVPEQRSRTAEEAVRRTAKLVLVELGRIERDETLVSREVGFLVRYENGASVETWMGNIELSPPVSRQPIYWLGRAERDEAIPALRSLLGENSKTVREGVVAAIGAHPYPDIVIPILADILDSDIEEDVRDEAADWLGDQNDKRCIPVLLKAVDQDKSRDVREEAVEALGQLRVDGAFEALVHIVTSHSDAQVRQEAVEAIAGQRTARSAKTLERVAFRDKSRSVQEESVDGLAEMPSDFATESLSNILSDHGSASIRQEAAEALSEIGTDGAMQALKTAVFSDASREVRYEALEALAEMSAGRGIPIVIEVVKTHSSTKMRRVALDLLGESRDPRARAVLGELAGSGS